MEIDNKKLTSDILEVINKHHSEIDNTEYTGFILFAAEDKPDEIASRTVFANVNIFMLMVLHRKLTKEINERLGDTEIEVSVESNVH